MCGIVGCVNIEGAKDRVENILQQLKHRGPDVQGIVAVNDKNVFGHALLNIVNKVEQPLKGKGVFVANCEIYNWKELAKKYEINVRNDAELLFQLLESDKFNYEELDGVFAFAYLKNNVLILARDLWGVKPLIYEFEQKGVIFTSEAKFLQNPVALCPGILASIDLDTQKVEEKNYVDIFLNNIKENDASLEYLEKLLIESVKKRVPKGHKVGVLFSGGIDSTLVAFILQKLGVEFTCYATGFYEEGLKYPEDLVWAKEAADTFDFDFTFVRVDKNVVDYELLTVMKIIESNNTVKVGVALPFYFAFEKAQEDGVKIMFSGLGSEEIFAGYQRHEQAQDINAECASGLKHMSERDLYRDDMLSMHYSMELRIPFLDKNLVQYALGISETEKIKDNMKKYILRKVALSLGVPEKYAMRPKRAAQYGSRFDNALVKLAKQKGFEKKSDYLMCIKPEKEFND